MDTEKIWQAVLGELEVILPKMQFATWFKDTSLEINQNLARVWVPHNFAKEWIEDKYKKNIFDSLKKASPELETIEVKIKKPKPFGAISLEAKATPQKESPKSTAEPSANLKKEYTFENFVVGNNNSLAYAVSKEVATNPGKLHNPLFIYGGVGLGKTHLAQAVGHEVLKLNESARVVYVSCETFTNDFISSIASKKMNEFKKTYRDTDVLIVDDIQFLSSKEGSQEEFFHTFNSLQQKSRQIIMTADKIPSAIPALEGRLASRFGGGMVVDIQPPNFETRIAILGEKCREKNCIVSDETIEYIARHISTNIRELEGALNRLVTYCQFNQITPTIKVASEILSDNISSANKQIDTAEIIDAVSKYFHVTKEEILGKGRQRELIHPRQVAIYLMREQTSKSLPEIGKIMGGKDHTTILHSQKRIAEATKIDMDVKSALEKIREMLLEIK